MRLSFGVVVVLVAGCGSVPVEPDVSVAELRFLIQPSDVSIGRALDPLIVGVVDPTGMIDTTSEVTITLAASDPNVGLTGQLTAISVEGLAVFENITSDVSGFDFSMIATAEGFGSVQSTTFSVFEPYTEFAVGGSYVCAIQSGITYCWGDNFYGQLWHPTAPFSTTPFKTPGGFSFVKIKATNIFSCGADDQQVVRCWGSNRFGQFGNGSTASSLTPVLMAPGMAFDDFSLGDGDYACGVNASGTYCWGNHPANVVNSLPGSTTPDRVGGNDSLVSIGSGFGHTCGIDVNGVPRCFGHSGLGAVGFGGVGSGFRSTATPVAVAAAGSFASISVGPDHSCAVPSVRGADLWCWGRNDRGQLGNGDNQHVGVATTITGTPFRKVAVGGEHTCGLDENGAAFCWGSNVRGQLGTGDHVNWSTPQAVASGLRFAEIQGGWRSTCAMTIGGELFCWGDNSWGQLGNGTTINSLVPVRVSLP